MSRSTRSNPFAGITTAETEKWWKQKTNRAVRAAVRGVRK